MPRIYPTEFRQRAIKDTATKLGIPANTLTRWCNHATLYTGKEITTENRIHRRNQTTQTRKRRAQANE